MEWNCKRKRSGNEPIGRDSYLRESIKSRNSQFSQQFMWLKRASSTGPIQKNHGALLATIFHALLYHVAITILNLSLEYK